MSQEVIVFADADHAHRAGFKTPDNRHPQDRNLLAVWPSQGWDGVRGLSLGRVTVTGAVWNRAHRLGAAGVLGLEQFLDILRARLRSDPMLWLDLS